MLDKLRRLELCMRECAATFGWNLSGNCLACNRGGLLFLLKPELLEDSIDYTLTYRFASFDRIYRILTGANVFPGTRIGGGNQHVDTWALMSVSTAMRTLTGRADRVATALAKKLTTPAENLDFLNYLRDKAEEEGETLDLSCEYVLTCLATENYDAAINAAAAALGRGDEGGNLYSPVLTYVGRARSGGLNQGLYS